MDTVKNKIESFFLFSFPRVEKKGLGPPFWESGCSVRASSLYKSLFIKHFLKQKKKNQTQIGNMTETMHFSLILNHYVQIQEKVKTNYLKIIIFVIEAK